MDTVEETARAQGEKKSESPSVEDILAAARGQEMSQNMGLEECAKQIRASVMKFSNESGVPYDDCLEFLRSSSIIDEGTRNSWLLVGTIVSFVCGAILTAVISQRSHGGDTWIGDAVMSIIGLGIFYGMATSAIARSGLRGFKRMFAGSVIGSALVSFVCGLAMSAR